jgi:predicted TPR repeat methyltransferase
MDIQIALPEPSKSYAQDEEWCLARIEGEWREMRFHDYSEIYEVEGLYERLFYDVLRCDSPATIRGMLEKELSKAGVPASDLRVLDLGAGNGLVGAELADLGVDRVVGVDILPEAADAAQRDHPDVYDAYHVMDLTDLAASEREELSGHDFNCLTCVAALGFGDIPPEAFRAAYNVVEPGGWVAFNLKEDFMNGHDRSGFSELISRASDEGILEMRSQQRYQHRVSTTGDPLHYIGVIASKREDIPAGLIG